LRPTDQIKPHRTAAVDELRGTYEYDDYDRYVSYFTCQLGQVHH